MDKQRVAVIAVHGVAAQQPGETARAIVDLLVSSAPQDVCYTSSSTEDLTLRVPPLDRRAVPHPEIAPDTPANPRREARSLWKSFAQSARSDFQRTAWASATTARAAFARGDARKLAPEPAGGHDPGVDRGLAITNYLLSKHWRNGAHTEAWDTTRIDLVRHDVGPDRVADDADDNTTQVDVFEMYWADLSRLSGAMPRIVSELFTMVFRLSKLGRETVDEMWGRLARRRDRSAPFAGLFAGAWTVVGGLQIVLDWLFVNGLALLFTQLGLLAIVFVSLGFASDLYESWLHRGVAFALAILSVLRFLYRRGDGGFWRGALPLAVFALSVAALTTRPVLLQWLTACTLLAVVSVVNELALRVADDRFPFVHFVGTLLWTASVALMLASALYETLHFGTWLGWRAIWIHAAMYATEVVLLLVKWWWIVVGFLLVVWLTAGLVAEREAGYESRAGIATGRLGIAVSFGMFLAVTMTGWAMLNGVLDASVEGVGYRPCIFVLDSQATALVGPPYAPNACLWATPAAEAAARALTGAAMPSAHTVLDDRYVQSTSSFSLLAALLVCLLFYLLAMYVPSVMAELKLLVDRTRDARQRTAHQRAGTHAAKVQANEDARCHTERARELGRWLSAGYRRLDLAVLVVTLVGVSLSAGVAVLFLTTLFDVFGHRTLFDDIVGVATRATQTLLKPLIFSAAGVGAALSLLGGSLSRHLPSLRGPLDIALDIDNHFREFPRTAIPRAHIFSRYGALLTHVAGKGYDRIVIVAHSQGTVISTELLRFLSAQYPLAPRPQDSPHVGAQKLPPISLLTVGCPLRQLYAARFPGLYSWVLANNGDVFGPRASDIGAQRWMNAFCSGDYVGRWLWSKARPGTTLDHPATATLADRAFGRADVYTGFDPAPPPDAVLQGAREVEVCLGLGAHTHYFERDQTTVAWMIDWLVRAPGIDPDQAAVAETQPVVKVGTAVPVEVEERA